MTAKWKKKVLKQGTKDIYLKGTYIMLDGDITASFPYKVEWRVQNQNLRFIVGEDEKQYSVTPKTQCTLYKVNMNYILREYRQMQTRNSFASDVCRTIIGTYISEIL